MPTHFTSGVSAALVATPLYQMPFLDPAMYHSWFSDFDVYRSGDWINTTSTTTGTRVVADADGGVLAFTTPALDDCLITSQWGGGNSGDVAETFTWASNKKMFLRGRFKVNDANDTDIVFGLAIADTSPLDASDGIYFSMVDGSAVVSAKLIKSGASTSTQALGTMTDDTFAIVAISYLPGVGFECYFNDRLVGTITSTSNAPTTEIAVTTAMQSGAAAITIASWDYLLVAKER